MKWSIPAKTFLLGEYVAVADGPALLLTTEPSFEVTLTSEPGLTNIHPDSPAGLFWQHSDFEKGLSFFDPYNGKGGLGASSAQFVGAYLANQYLQGKSPCKTEMLESYYRYAWQGDGIRPSGYDVLAQSLQGCAYINAQQRQYKIYSWPFHDLAFILLHTGQKLATHQHLQALNMPEKMQELAIFVESAQFGFESGASHRIIDAVNQYHHRLAELGFVAEQSQKYIEMFQRDPDVLAVKGCGAMGADVILLLVCPMKMSSFRANLVRKGWDVIACSDDLHAQNRLNENNLPKGLEISA